MTHITIDDFLNTKYDGYDFDGAFFYWADECFQAIYHHVKHHWDKEDGQELSVTTYMFFKGFDRVPVKDIMNYIVANSNLHFQDNDYVFEELENKKIGGELESHYNQFKRNLRCFLNALTDHFAPDAPIETTETTLTLKVKDILALIEQKTTNEATQP